MSVLVLERASAVVLNGLTLTLDGGLTVALGGTADGTSELLRLVAGLDALRSGTVRVGGMDPRRNPAARRRIGVVLEPEFLPPGPTVGQAVTRGLRARGCDDSVQAALDRLSLSSWAPRAVSSLNHTEQRTVALAMALSGPPALLAVENPFANFALESGRLWRLLWDAERAGVSVLCTTAIPAEAFRIGGRVLILQRGRVARQPMLATPDQLLPGTGIYLNVRCSSPRALAAVLLQHPAVSAVHYDERAAVGSLRVTGPDTQQTALAVLECARSQALRIHAIAAAQPALEDVQSATAALVRAAYDNAYRVAGPPQPLAANTGAPR